MSSNEQIVSYLEFDKTYLWDFLQARGKPLDFDAAPYCFGGPDSICEIPETETFGNLKLSFSSATMSGLAETLNHSNRLEFALISTGDNDPNDCLHSDFSIEYELQYVRN